MKVHSCTKRNDTSTRYMIYHILLAKCICIGIYTWMGLIEMCSVLCEVKWVVYLCVCMSMFRKCVCTRVCASVCVYIYV